MAELFEKLEKTGALLSSAIDQYLDVCVAIGSYPQLSFAGVSRAFFDRVASELPLVSSHETKIKQAKSTIGRIINSSPAVHINSLPPEILARIFHAVVDTCGLTYDLGNSVPLPRYPDFLSHVCTRWRQVALDSPRLWTHIDLVRFSSPNHGFKPRAEAFVSRAGSCLFDVHIFQQPDCHTYDHQGMLNIITVTAPQTRSLELVARYIPGIGEYPRTIDHCFNNYVPGMLTKLSLAKRFNLTDNSTRSPHFIDSHDRSNQTATWPPPLDVPAEHLDALLLPVTKLKLDGIYFPWTHQAYHGLVELRLLDDEECTPVLTKLELQGILSASPKLRLLHSEIAISDNLPMGSLTAPVHLNDLEELKLNSSEEENPHVILSLLASGPKPLRFSFTFEDNIDTGDPGQEWLFQMKEFFKRSNITELRLQHATWPPDVGPEHILESLPNLRVLALESCFDDPHHFSIPFPPPDPNPPYLDIMYMSGCIIALGKLARTVKHLRVELVVFWRCDFIEDAETLQYRRDHEVIKAQLGVICQSFIWIDQNEPNPVKQWH